MRYFPAFFFVLVWGCTITTEEFFYHKETSKLQWRAVESIGDIKLDEPYVFLPSFRGFTWDRPQTPALIVLSDKPIDVRIRSAKLSGPEGEPEQLIKYDRVISVNRKRRRSTTFSERMASGGFFDGQRMTDTDILLGRLNLEFAAKQFNQLSALQLDIVASVDDQPFETYTFELRYKERTMPTFITR